MMRIALGRPLRLVVARHLDRAFHRLGAGIAEEHRVGEARRAQPLGEPLALRDAVEVGDVPELARLLLSAATRCGCAWPSAFTATPPRNRDSARRRWRSARRPRRARRRGRHAHRSAKMRRHAIGSIGARAQMAEMNAARCASPAARFGSHSIRRLFRNRNRETCGGGAVNTPRPPCSGFDDKLAENTHAGKCRNMWTRASRTLAPESRHIVAFMLSGTTSRAADCSLSSIL